MSGGQFVDKTTAQKHAPSKDKNSVRSLKTTFLTVQMSFFNPSNGPTS